MSSVGRFVLIFVSCFLISLRGWAQESCADKYKELIHGPYRTSLYPGASLCFVRTDDRSNPVALVLERVSMSGVVEIDRYGVGGGDPEIESIFFFPVKGRENVLVIVSWVISSRGLGTYGKMYQVYSYAKDSDGHLVVNNDITNNPEMYGMEGYMEGGESFFKYKTAADVKGFIRGYLSEK